MEFLAELLLQLVLEILRQILFEFAVSLGWQSLTNSVRREREAPPVRAALAHLFIGVAAGAASIAVFGTRITEHSLFPGVSLIAAPLGTGIAMHRFGRLWSDGGKDRPVLFTFRAGALFAFGMALARFLFLSHGW